MNVRELTDQVNDVADSLFPNRSDASILLKLFEELGELVKKPDDPDEHADVFILLLDFASRHGVDVEKAVLSKLSVLPDREWKLNVGTGVMQSVK